MKVIGLCGGSGSGKGAVCELFSEMDVSSIDTDRVYHRLTSSPSPCLEELALVFGKSIIDERGALDRRVLRGLVFGSCDADERRRKLNEITHKHILGEARRIISEKRDEGAKAIIVDAPLLFESGFDKECDVTVCVIADKDIRIKRIMARDGISAEDAKRRIDGQIPNDELVRRVDYVIENNGDLDILRDEVKRVYKKILI